VAQLKARAVRDGRDVQDVAAELLAEALRESAGEDKAEPLLSRNLPVIKARFAGPTAVAALTAQEMSDFIKAADHQHEVERFEKALGHQHVDRTGP